MIKSESHHDIWRYKAVLSVAVIFLIVVSLYLSRLESLRIQQMNQEQLTDSGDQGNIPITANAIAGVYVTEIFINVTCRTSLNSSWNLVSSPCIEPNKSVISTFSSVNTSLLSVHSFNTSAQVDQWKAYIPSADSFAQSDLDKFSVKLGYWVNLNANSNITFLGNISIPSFMGLVQGWNLIGWPSNDTKNVSIALASIAGSYSSVYAYYSNDSNDPWKTYNPSLDPSLSDLKYMEPFHGYWVYMTQNATLKVI